MGNSTKVLAAIAAGHNRIDLLKTALEISAREANSAVNVLRGRKYIRGKKLIGGNGTVVFWLTTAGKEWLASGREVEKGQGERNRRSSSELRACTWWHFRTHKVATMNEILSTHADGTEKGASNNLYKFIAGLEKVGILKRSSRRIQGNSYQGSLQWKLAKDLGPRPPVIRHKRREVFDPNSGQIFQFPTIEPSHEQ